MKNPQKYTKLFIDESSPDNPFGPNYKNFSHQQKIGYKYSKMKSFVIPTDEDLIYKQQQDLKFLGSLLMSFSYAIIIGGAVKMGAKRVNSRLYEAISRRQFLYYPLWAMTGFGFMYKPAEQRYYHNVKKYFLDKYLDQAIKNGFKDYQISK